MFYSLFYKAKYFANPKLFLFHFFSFFFIVIPFFIVVFKAFTPAPGSKLSDNFAFVNSLLFSALFRSVVVAIFTLVFILLISYPFAYLVANIRSRFARMLIMSMVLCPLWSSFFVKLIGLKSFFDLLYGEMNSTRGLVYVVIGLVYINTPIAILTFYNSISNIPKNIINASLDLGRTQIQTIGKIVIPYTNKAILAVVFLVFLPSLSCISIADFMNKSSGSQLIAQVMNEWAGSGGTTGIATNRLAFAIVFLIFLILFVYSFCGLLCQLAKKVWEWRNV